MSRKPAIKRSLSVLRRGTHADQQDILRRTVLERDKQAEQRSKRRKTEEEAFVKTWEGYLRKWTSWNLQSLNTRLVDLPELAPHCA